MLEVAHLVRRFGDKTVVDDVSFTVPAGGMTGFVGANGAGKTTTMRMIMGVLAAHDGEVRWNGRPATAADRRRFGYMPEERGLYPKQQVLEQLIYLARLRGAAAAAATTHAGELLERLGLAGREKSKLESLSMGNQQRVQIAAAMICDPQSLILDEPFSGLDPMALDAMAGLLKEKAAQGLPILFSSHQLDVVERLCDRLVILAGGKVVVQGLAAELAAAGPKRYRLVLDRPATWLREAAGVTVVEIEGTTTVLELHQMSTDELLTLALSHGSVRELAVVRSSVSDLYREVVA
jgi:ABC-2 type transport system ATP-binding protein